jgi:hypothetical protein
VSLTDGHAKVQSSFSPILAAHRLEQDFAWARCVAAGKTRGVGILPRFIRLWKVEVLFFFAPSLRRMSY